MKKNTLPILLCILFAILARLSGILYSYMATDVVYQSSVICQILPALRQILSAMSFASAAGGLICAVIEKRTIKVLFITYTATVLADSAIVILIDVTSGIFSYDTGRLLLGIIYRLGLVLYSVGMLWLGLVIGKALLNRGGNISISAATASVLPAAVDFIAVMWKSTSSLIEWEFMPFASEIYTMLFEIGTVSAAGILSAIIAIILAKRK